MESLTERMILGVKHGDFGLKMGENKAKMVNFGSKKPCLCKL